MLEKYGCPIKTEPSFYRREINGGQRSKIVAALNESGLVTIVPYYHDGRSYIFSGTAPIIFGQGFFADPKDARRIMGFVGSNYFRLTSGRTGLKQALVDFIEDRVPQLAEEHKTPKDTK